MSLKARLRIAILGLVVPIVLAISILYLQSAIAEGLEDAGARAELIASHVRSHVLDRIAERLAQRTPPLPPGTPLAEQKQLWYAIVRDDAPLARMLEKMVSSSSSVIEIMVSDEQGRILASSIASRTSSAAMNLPEYEVWQRGKPWRALREVLTRNRDYATSVALGLAGETDPVLTVRVVLSSVLLRQRIEPQLRKIAALLLGALGVSVFLAFVVSNLVSTSVRRIGRNIELISAGEAGTEEPYQFESKDLIDLQSKLALLGKKYTGFREDAANLRSNIAHMLQRLEEAVLIFGSDGSLRMVGAPAERVLMRRHDELIGKNYEELFPHWTPLGAALHTALRLSAPVRDRPITLDRGAPPAVRLIANIEPIEGAPGQPPGLLVTLRDAESRRQIESQLDISSRLAAMSRITGGVAHEIKNPLNAVSLHLEILRRRLDSQDGALLDEVNVIAREIQRLDRVVKTFLDFNRPLELKWQLCDLAEVTQEIVTLVAPQAEAAGVRAVTEVECAPAWIRADRDLLKQAVLNVVTNGIEAMANGGELALRIRQSFDEYVLTVADQGAGILPEVQDKIFTLYFSTKPHGSGIGLAMAFRVVQLHSGRIYFDSEQGKGTSFHLAFPVAQNALHGEQARSAGQGQSGAVH